MNTPESPAIEPGRVTAAMADGVATITFSHPKSNSMPGVTLAELAKVIAAAGANPEVRVVVLQSAGEGAFCAGASFAELQALTGPEAGKAFFMGFANVIMAMIRCPRLIVTRVHGKAVGGGVGIVAASDYAIASEGASIRLSELAVGLGPFIIGPCIEKKIGMGAFSAMAIDADWRNAQWAAVHGLYAEVHADTAALDAAITKRVAALNASNPEAMVQLKQVMWSGTEGWPELLAARAGMSGLLAMSDFTARVVGRSRS